jgi:radical SAM protein with 4Fe4S-binding SPASM domain
MDNPRLSSHIRVIQREEKYIYINPNIPRWLVTDRAGNLILSLFDGRHPYAEIIALAQEGFPAIAPEKIEKFCRSVMDSGLMDEVPPRPRQHRMRLSSVHLSLSDSCNLSCRYCYAKARVEKNHPRLTLDEYRKLTDDILTINPGVTFTLTGGEPLLNKDCFSIAAHIKEHGGKVLLLSNGTLFSDRNIGQIAALFDLVTVSIDGPDSRIHGLTRGDSYAGVMRAIDLMESHSVNYTLSMTVTKENIGHIGSMAGRYGSRLNFAPYFPVLGEASDLAITGAEYHAALKSAAGVNPLGYCERSLDGALRSPCHKCAIGDGEFSISATGDVYPCQLLHADEFYAGNVHDASIIEIYSRSAAIGRCAALDVDSMKGCKDCAIKYICGGSCRARAYYECGDIQSSSDFCIYEQEAFLDGILSIYSRNLLD